MAHNLDPARNELQPIDGWAASDSRTLAFTVQLPDGSAKDIAADTLEWALLDRAYDGRADAIVTEGDTGVAIVVTDSAAGEFEVRIDEDTLSGEWGEYVQRVSVDPSDETKQSWHGDVVLDADGSA